MSARALHVLRLLLGAVLGLTSAEYFLPFAVPFAVAHEWSDPTAVRIMSAFDKSGLLAVAKFIHLVAGALLLANRTIPFALAAVMPVNVCGFYISLFIEADPLVGLLAILMVALNALLMLAYLPSYRGVIEGRALADGEGPEPGRNFESLFVNPLSGAPTRAYAEGAMVLAAALAFYWFVVPFANGTMGLVTLAVPALLLLAGWVGSAIRRPKS